MAKQWLDQIPSTEDPIFMKMTSQEAIVVRNARKYYGKANLVLNGLNMTVSRGTIYSLLGASGCGKTTLLSCVVGVRRLDSGTIWCLGGKPGSKGSGVPGPRLGYMPQEISLVQEFTVLNALYYFGRINGVNEDMIEKRYLELATLFDLPPKNRMVKHMSGGQQRRVSFAAALIHNPELLILDEPTVGLDPILRENIWSFLVKLSVEEGTAIVITTHYIEEAKQANKIGLLRCGQLLAEAPPGHLLRKFQCQTLEEAFLALSQRQKDKQDRGIMEIETEYYSELDEVVSPAAPRKIGKKNSIYPMNENRLISQKSWRESSFRRFKALIIKNTLQFLRHPGGILFALLFPIAEVMCFFLSIGGDPKGLKLAVVNDEAGNCNFGNNTGHISYDPVNLTCYYKDLSCTYLNGFDDSIAGKVYYSTIDEANRAVLKSSAKVVGVVHFAKNFSRAFEEKRDSTNYLDEGTIAASEIPIFLDMGDRQIGMFMQTRLYNRYFEITRKVYRECGIPEQFANMPVKFETPIFGKMDQSYRSFVAPVFILTLVFFLATAVACFIIITDRHEGVWDRSLVQGVKTTEILMAHLLTQFTVILVQSAICLSLSFLVFNLVCEGPLLTAICLVILMGLCGMCYGFLISVYSKSHTLANFIATGSFYPVILLCGCIWPLEGMPKFLHWFSLILPITVPGLSLRGIFDQGYSVNEPIVYDGFLIVSGWTAFFIALCLIGLRVKEVT
ncbi:ABC transporter G family member 23 isoform X2 [Leptopilina heterotoma]|uniref:ABC transporter G family member 23 isoform X2 n=1 Tax=Leptopilina heterotoma TaxID=63436 RepID=UPI001CA92152|nr:ABC transporter G family member 23 isoform X2 [Leptopilina heterotoma]